MTTDDLIARFDDLVAALERIAAVLDDITTQDGRIRTILVQPKTVQDD